MKILIIGNYGAKNLGDEMILEGLLNSLKNIYSNPQITVLSGDPSETTKSHNVASSEKFPAGIKSFFRFFKSKTPKILSQSDLAILGGGGLFGSLSFHANIIWAIQAFMVYYYKKPLIMYGQSVGEIKNPLLKKIIQKIFQKAKFIAVRDEKSIENLKNIGVTKEIHLMPDLAFAKEIPDQIPKEKIAIVAMRQMAHLPAEFLAEIAKFINWLTEDQKYQLKLIDFQKNHEADQILSQKLFTPKITYLPDIENLNDLFTHFKSASFVLGMRLHSIIAALKTNTPFIAISYNEKVENLLKTAGFSSIKIEDITFEQLKSAFANLPQSPKIAEYLKKASQDHRETETILKRITL